jgi:predicted peptidase
MAMERHVADIPVSKTVRLNYLVHVPLQALRSPSDRWPMILFLHGRGESGDDPALVELQGLPPHIARQPDFPFIVIAPQCPVGTWWPELTDGLARLLDLCLASYPIEPRQMYLTGLSMGGYGVWYLGTAWPGRFAALAPICGGGHGFHGFPERVRLLKETPVWAFHGAQDDVVPVSASEVLVNVLRECGGEVDFTVYPEAGHDAWTATYANPELYRWFLRHKRL